MRKIRRNLEGIRDMSKLPGALVVVDVHREGNAVREARRLKIPTICLIDTDSDPEFADVPIPGNDDAMRAIEVVLTHLADAVEEGIKGRTAFESDDGKQEPRRRSRRPAMGRADEGLPVDSVSEAPSESSPAGTGDGESAGTTGAPDLPDTGLMSATATEPDTPS